MSVIPQSSGPQGAPGASGANGAQGPAGPAGRVELVTCKTVTKRVHRRKVKRQRCTTKLVSGTVKLKTAAATISRAGRVYAHGTASGGGRHSTHLTLTLTRRRHMPAGRYILTVTSRHGRELHVAIKLR